MATVHAAAGVNETNRNLAVAASAPAVGHQTTRAAATVVVVPFSYSNNGKFGGP